MIEYHKIQSVFLRDPENRNKTFLMWQFAAPVFAYLQNNSWEWTEKIDGTNIRVLWDGKDVRFGGRTNDAQMPVFLMQRLQTLFTPETLAPVFPDLSEGVHVMLFGEGYGAKIQKGGGRYIATGTDFILFDVLFNDNIYLERHNVEDVATKLGIKAVPVVGSGTLAEAVEFTKAGYKSKVAADAGFDAEGVVLRPSCEMRDRLGRRIITKLKYRDF